MLRQARMRVVAASRADLLALLIGDLVSAHVPFSDLLIPEIA
jgi:hypothetical protein